MPIKGFIIENCGPIRLAKSDAIPELMIIIGPNGVGKSTLLQALFYHLKESKHLEPECKVEVYVEESIRPEVWYYPPHRGPSIGAIIRFLNRRFIVEDLPDTLSSTTLSLSIPVTPIGPGVVYSFEETRGRKSTDVVLYFKVKDTLIRYKQLMNSIILSLFRERDYVSKEQVPDIFYPFRKDVKDILGIDFIDVEITDKGPRAIFRTEDGHLVDFDDLSSGEKDAIALLLPFIKLKIDYIASKILSKQFKVPRGILVLIDGIEEYLHPKLQVKVVDYIRKTISELRDKGISVKCVIATHSEAIMNFASYNELYVLLPSNIVGQRNQLIKVAENEDVLNELKFLLELPALAAGKPLLLIEGKDDYNILKKWFPEIENYTTLIPMSGKRNILSEAIIILDKMISQSPALKYLKVYAIVDRDIDSYVEEITKKLYNIRVHVLSTSCIENLLLRDYNALLKAIKSIVKEDIIDKYGLNNVEAVKSFLSEIVKDPDTIRREITRHVEQRMRRTLLGLSKDLLDTITSDGGGIDIEKVLENRIRNVIQALQEAYSTIEHEVLTIANDIEKALSLFDGKLLLNKMASKLGLKSNELKLLIASLQRDLDTIPEEIQKFISNLIYTVFMETE